MNVWFLVMIVVYLGMLALVGRHSWKKTKSAEDYIMAGSRLGVMVGMLTFAATLFSTFTLLGMPDYFRTHGVGSWIFLAIADAAMFFLILIWIIAIGCVRSLGGVEAMFAQVRETNEALLSIPGPKGLLTPQFLIASFFAIVLIPVTQPQVTTRLAIITLLSVRIRSFTSQEA